MNRARNSGSYSKADEKLITTDKSRKVKDSSPKKK
jgi:hypothetical protein